jgi:hypothetical protein
MVSVLVNRGCDFVGHLVSRLFADSTQNKGRALCSCSMHSELTTVYMSLNKHGIECFIFHAHAKASPLL